MMEKGVYPQVKKKNEEDEIDLWGRENLEMMMN
jgi:hypothetical protein